MDEYLMDFPSTFESVGKARHAVVNFAQTVGLAGEPLHDFASAIGEALANAAEHGHRDGSRFSIHAAVVDGALRVDVKDGGHGFHGWEATEYPMPTSDSPRGFGTFIMRELMDRVEYSEGGSRIRLIKYLPIATPVGMQRKA